MKTSLNIFAPLLSLCFVVTLTACSSDSSSSNGGGGGGNTGFTVDELGYNPNDRWQESGSFSYNYSMTFNGVRCETKQAFNSKASYCMGLQDETLNNSCAIEARKASYGRECGNDFQKVNFKENFYRSGFDQRLQKDCATASSAQMIFKTGKTFCSFLKDEALHGNCFWDLRANRFKDLQCVGSFSPAPAAGPAPRPVPLPDRPDSPDTPDELDQIPVVQELRRHQIAVSIDWVALRNGSRPRAPGEPTLEQELDAFWKEVEANKADFILRKDQIRSIEVSIFTSFDFYSRNQRLSLNYRTPKGFLSEYFPLFDKARRHSAELGIRFGFIEDSFDTENSYLPLREVLAALEKNWNELIQLKGVIQELSLGSRAEFQPSTRTLVLSNTSITSDLKKILPLLKPLGQLFAWAEREHVTLDTRFDVEKDSQALQAALQYLQSHLRDLTALSKAGMLKTFSFNFSPAKAFYWPGLKALELSVGTGSGSVEKTELSKKISALGKMATLSLEIKRTIEPMTSEIDSTFVKAVTKLETVWSKVFAKAHLIKNISLGSKSQYYRGLQELEIGGEDSVRETESVISGI